MYTVRPPHADAHRNAYHWLRTISVQEDGTISPASIQEQFPGHAPGIKNTPSRISGSRIGFLFILIIACLIVPSAASATSTVDVPGANVSAGPQVVHIGTYVVDFSNYNPREGTFETNFYVTLTSDRPVNTSDFEMMNGHATTIGFLVDTPTRKYFRVFGTMDSEPDFHRYPFDRQTLQIIVEPRVLNTSELVLVIDNNASGLDELASIPGWKFGEDHAYVMNHSYTGEDHPYSRAVFSYDISRDSFSTFLKFFLPVMLIVIVSLSSLLMRVTSRLGLNASMLLAAVLIHWRISDAIPLVEYATFLDYFMIITYATLVMVLLSGILLLWYNENKRQECMDRVSRWSSRIIPVISISLYLVLFLTLLL